MTSSLYSSTIRRSSAVILVLACFPGCGFLPSAGPSSSKIIEGSGKSGAAYQVIPVDARVIGAINKHASAVPYLSAEGRGTDRLFADRGLEHLGPVRPQAVTVGDVVHVTIFETDSALFRPSLVSGTLTVSPSTALPPQIVDPTGEISVPYIGRVLVLGRLTGEIEQDIRDGLKNKTADPQVVVSVSERKGGNLVSVAGDVRAPAQVPVPLSGIRLVDAVAAAGGSLSAPYDTMVSVTREGHTRSDTLQDVFRVSAKNIALQAGDTVILRKRALTFLTFGSTGRVGSHPITVEDLSLSEAVAASGGPADMQANPASIFVYRQESVGVLQALNRKPADGRTNAVVYQLDLQQPDGFFLANRFAVRDRDLIYYAPAGSMRVQKFMGLVNTFLAPAISAASAAASAQTLSE